MSMSFADADRRYAELKQQYDAGMLNQAQFDDQLRAIMVQDGQGRWWAKARETGDWNFYDQATGEWVRADPPGGAPTGQPPSMPVTSSPTTQSGAESPMQTSSQQPWAQAQGMPEGAYGAQPELSSGLKIVFYILSFLVWLVGVILYFVYRNKPAQEDRSAARMFLILGVVSLLLSCVCSFSFAGMGILGMNY